MASLTIRNLDESLKQRLRLQAAVNSRSMEEEVRQILRTAIEAGLKPADESLAERIRRRFEGLDADAINMPARSAARRSPDLDVR